jgi:hypothetical protein
LGVHAQLARVPPQDAEKVRLLRSHLESILNVAQRLRLRCFHRLRPCWTAFLSILQRWRTPCPWDGSKADGERGDAEWLPASFGEGFEGGLLCRSCQPNVWRRSISGWCDNCQNTVAELLSVIFRRSSWLSKKMMPRSVPVSYRRFTSVSNPVQLKNLTGPPAICPGVRSSGP